MALSLSTLPAELILQIAESTWSQPDLWSLTLTTKRFSEILVPYLKSINVRFHRSTGLTWAINHTNVDLTASFLDAGADPDSRVISTEEYEALEQKYAFSDPYMASLRQSGKFETPLYLAVRKNSTRIVQVLLQWGADPNTKGYRGYPTALAKAARLLNDDMRDDLRTAMGLPPVIFI